MGAPHSDREWTSAYPHLRDAHGHSMPSEERGAEANVFSAVAALDHTAADRACALLPVAPPHRVQILCLDEARALQDLREASHSGLRAELARNPIRTRAAIAQSSLRHGERRTQTLLISRDDAEPSSTTVSAKGTRRPLIAGGWIDHPADCTETVARLLEFHLRKGRPAVDAVRAAISKLQGAVAIAAILPKDPDRIFVVAKETDVLVGFSCSAACAVSDASMRPLGSEFSALYPGDVAILTPEQIVTVDLDGMQIVKHRPSPALVDPSSHVATP